MSWHQSRFAAFDLESTDKNPETALIVSAAIIGCGGGKPTDTLTWLAAVEVPDEASKINGITTEYAMANGCPAAEVINQVAGEVTAAVVAGSPIVGQNVPYDLTLLDRELRRNGLATIDERTGGTPLLAIDTLVLDKHVLPFRRRVSAEQGARQLITLAQVYGQQWDAEAAHAADYDALQAARIAYRIGVIAHTPPAHRPDWVLAERSQRFDDLAGITLVELHERQIVWAAEDAAGFQQWLRSPKAGDKQDPDAVVDGSWPLRPFVEAVTA